MSTWKVLTSYTKAEESAVRFYDFCSCISFLVDVQNAIDGSSEVLQIYPVHSIFIVQLFDLFNLGTMVPWYVIPWVQCSKGYISSRGGCHVFLRYENAVSIQRKDSGDRLGSCNIGLYEIWQNGGGRPPIFLISSRIFLEYHGMSQKNAVFAIHTAHIIYYICIYFRPKMCIYKLKGYALARVALESFDNRPSDASICPKHCPCCHPQTEMAKAPPPRTCHEVGERKLRFRVSPWSGGGV